MERPSDGFMHNHQGVTVALCAAGMRFVRIVLFHFYNYTLYPINLVKEKCYAVPLMIALNTNYNLFTYVSCK